MFENIVTGTPVGLKYNVGDEVEESVCLFIERDNEKNINYFLDENGPFAFSDKFINEKVTVEFDNLDFDKLIEVIKQAKQ